MINVDLVRWVIEQANEGNFDKNKLASGVCKIISNNQMADKISFDLVQWVIEQANEGNFDKEELASAVCHKTPDQRPTILLFDEETQKKLAVMNKTKTCQMIPWLGSNMQEWIYEEAIANRFDQDAVFKVLKREESDGAEALSLKIHPGLYIKFIETVFSLLNCRAYTVKRGWKQQ